MPPETLTSADERSMLDRIKRAVDLVDQKGQTPNAAIEKIAREDRLGPGTITLMATAYNTGRQLGQWRANTSILDKTASFEMADAAEVIGAIYPDKADTHKEALHKAAFDGEYAAPPHWLPIGADRVELRRHDMTKTASAKEETPQRHGEPADRMRKAYGYYERAKNAYEAARRHMHDTEDRLKVKLAALTDYFRQPKGCRLDYAQAEHAARVYHGPAAIDFLKMAYERARLKEPGADEVRLGKQAFDLGAEPFTLIDAGIKLAEEVIQARVWAKEAFDLFKEVEGNTVRPFAKKATEVPPSSLHTLRLFEPEPEKRAILEQTIGTGVGVGLARGFGQYPKTKDDLIEDEWLKLEDPRHQNELRKIRVHAMLNGILTDPEDPISGHDPDKVIAAYNEIAQMAPRIAEQPAALKPILRKRLAGHTEPFEAKEMVDIEKGLRDAKNIQPSSQSLASAPDSILG